MTVRRPAEPYAISWCPVATVEELATKRGWTKDMGVLDFLEEYEVEERRTFKTFDEAADAGRAALADDYFGEVRLSRMIITLRFRVDETTDDAVWHIHASDQELDENEPDYVPDLSDD